MQVILSFDRRSSTLIIYQHKEPNRHLFVYRLCSNEFAKPPATIVAQCVVGGFLFLALATRCSFVIRRIANHCRYRGLKILCHSAKAFFFGLVGPKAIKVQIAAVIASRLSDGM